MNVDFLCKGPKMQFRAFQILEKLHLEPALGLSGFQATSPYNTTKCNHRYSMVLERFNKFANLVLFHRFDLYGNFGGFLSSR